ncbi:MAG: hypothetical protein QM831_02145 [Kofleriaceae bacterium]
MFKVGALAVICNCYDASQLAAGSPCAPNSPNCPDGQACVLVSGIYRCEVNGHDDLPPDAPSGSNVIPDGLPGTSRITYKATVSVCTTQAFPGPMFCSSTYNDKELVLTSGSQFVMQPMVAYLRFDFDGVLAGKAIANVALQMTAVNTTEAASPASGTVWQANAFTAQQVQTMIPGKTTLLATDSGAVVKGAVVEWSLPPSQVAPNDAACLELESDNADDVIYGDKSSANPPTLVIDYL